MNTSIGDSVSLFVDSFIHPAQISISHIFGDPCSKLSRNPLWNCASFATIMFMKTLGIRSVGLSLSLHKGLPLGFGLRSSAASATVAAITVNEIFGGKLSSMELVLAGLKLKEKVLSMVLKTKPVIEPFFFKFPVQPRFLPDFWPVFRFLTGC